MLTVTVEYADPGKPSKSSKPVYPEDAVSLMREACFRVACGEYVAVYLTKSNPIKRSTTPRGGSMSEAIYRLWKCDDGTFDIVDDSRDDGLDGICIVATNVPGHKLAEAYLNTLKEPAP